MFVVPFLLFVIAKGREYYVAPAYPMLYAAGSVRVEAWLDSLRSPWASILRRLVWTALVVDIAIAAAVTVPLAPVNSAWFKTASEVNGEIHATDGAGQSILRSLEIHRSCLSVISSQDTQVDAIFRMRGDKLPGCSFVKSS
jgi:hypothetical protein